MNSDDVVSEFSRMMVLIMHETKWQPPHTKKLSNSIPIKLNILNEEPSIKIYFSKENKFLESSTLWLVMMIHFILLKSHKTEEIERFWKDHVPGILNACGFRLNFKAWFSMTK